MRSSSCHCARFFCVAVTLVHDRNHLLGEKSILIKFRLSGRTVYGDRDLHLAVYISAALKTELGVKRVQDRSF